jgi:cyclohexyl-isocyanide hydratase
MVHVVSKDGRAVTTDCGFSILPRSSFAACPQADLLCVPGGHGVRDAIADTALVDFVWQQAKGADYITSVCTGAFILGAAGYLQGKKATCHWAYTQLLPLFGATHLPARVVHDSNLITAGGVTSGIDFALSLIATIASEDVARTIQLALEYDPAPPFGGGSLESSSDETVDSLRARVYDKAASDMKIAIQSII